MTYGNMKCDYSGRKRKRARVVGEVYERRVEGKPTTLHRSAPYNHRSSDQTFSSAPDRPGAVGSVPEAKRVEGYTVGIGYNKGGYQVIPESEIKDMGK